MALYVNCSLRYLFKWECFGKLLVKFDYLTTKSKSLTKRSPALSHPLFSLFLFYFFPHPSKTSELKIYTNLVRGCIAKRCVENIFWSLIYILFTRKSNENKTQKLRYSQIIFYRWKIVLQQKWLSVSFIIISDFNW